MISRSSLLVEAQRLAGIPARTPRNDMRKRNAISGRPPKSCAKSVDLHADGPAAPRKRTRSAGKRVTSIQNARARRMGHKKSSVGGNGGDGILDLPPKKINLSRFDSRAEPWIDREPYLDKGSPPIANLLDAYHAGRLVHRYEWHAAVNTLAGKVITEQTGEINHQLKKTAKLPAKEMDDLRDAFVDQMIYEFDLGIINRSPTREKKSAGHSKHPTIAPSWPLPESDWNRICGPRRVLQKYFSDLHRSAFDLGYAVDEGVVPLKSQGILTLGRNTMIDRLLLSIDRTWYEEIRSACHTMGLDEGRLANLDAVMSPLERSRASALDLIEIIDSMIRKALTELDKPEIRATAPANALNVKCDLALGEVSRLGFRGPVQVKLKWIPIVRALAEAPRGIVWHVLMEKIYEECGGQGNYKGAFRTLKCELNMALKNLNLEIKSLRREGWQMTIHGQHNEPTLAKR